MSGLRRATEGGVALAVCLWAAAAGAHEASPVRADFVPPAPGSYRLERIMPAPDGAVLDSNRKRGQLAAYTHGKVTLLSLMYTTCTDDKGCPLAFYSLQMIQRDLEKSAGARGKVRLVSLSFDPERDTPEVLRAYGAHTRKSNRVPWHFLTAASAQSLAPVLDGFGQDVSRPARAKDKAPGDLLHVLKLFLVDRDGWVREIYTTSYLVPQVVLNDIETLLLEQRARVN